MIKEVVVVEGRDDEERVKKSLDCECLITHGYGFGERLLSELENINRQRGIIVFTDPDYAGKNIRRKIRERIPNAKHAYLSREKARLGDDIGIENASFEDIRIAIKKARPEYIDYVKIYTIKDMFDYKLIGPNSKKRRVFLCDELSIGYSNGKRLLMKLNTFQIDKKEVEEILKRFEEIDG